MDEQATTLRKYEDALTTLLFYARTGRLFDAHLKTQFHDVSLDVERYRDTADYHDAIFRADTRAWELANLGRPTTT
jgi:hypothetical protein